MNDQTIVKIAVLQEQVGQLRKDIAEIRENHLNHISKDLTALANDLGVVKQKIAYYAGGLALLVVALDFVIKFIK